MSKKDCSRFTSDIFEIFTVNFVNGKNEQVKAKGYKVKEGILYLHGWFDEPIKAYNSTVWSSVSRDDIDSNSEASGK